MLQLESSVFPPYKMPSLNLKYITQKLGAQTLNEVPPFEFETQVPVVGIGDYYGSDSEEENHEVEHYLKEKRMCNSSMASSLQNNNNNTISVHNLSKPLRPLEDSSNSTENIQNQTQTERHSSEDELLYDRPPPEKRKYSQVCSWGMTAPDLNSNSSSDEEVKELCFSAKNSPIQFGSSPPKHVPRFFRRFADSNTLTFATCPLPQQPVCESSAQPRKRHRHSYTIERHYLQNGRCVDFEKMQQKQTTKRNTSQGVTSRGARVVRIKSITHNISRVPPRLLCDPAVYSFKSLSTINPLTPVEEPTVAAF